MKQVRAIQGYGYIHFNECLESSLAEGWSIIPETFKVNIDTAKKNDNISHAILNILVEMESE